MHKIFRFFFVFGFILVIPTLYTFSQVSINTDNSPPDPSAILDVKSATMGLLPPRVALTAINSAAPVTSPAIGLHVYNTATAGISPNNVIPGNYFWNGTRWIPESPPQGVNVGDMLYWNGMQWVGIPAGANGQVLTLTNGVPSWGGNQFPIVTPVAVTSITQTTATGGGNVISDGGSTVTARGICWSTNTNPTTSDNHTTDGSGTGIFVSNMTGLTANTLYYVKAYATNSVGTYYSGTTSFTTLQTFSIGLSYGGGIIFWIDATGQNGLISSTSDQSTGAQWGCYGISISTGTDIGTGHTNTTAIVSGCSTTGIAAQICATLTLNGYSDWFLPSKDELNQMYLQRNVIGGFAPTWYWSSSEYSPTSAYIQTFSGGSQDSNLKGTAYNVRAIRAFSLPATLPVVTTTAVTAITQTTATGGGNVTSDGGATVTARGVCWSTGANPTTSDSHTTDGSGTGSFVSNMTGLTANTPYYVRAYATNSTGTSYGNQVTFTTLSIPVLPAITTTAVTGITQTTGIGGGNVTSDGGANVTARGVCWSTSASPTTSDSHTTDGSGTGSFVSNLTGLTTNTQYYVRSYATNSVGTSYGNQVSFTTLISFTIGQDFGGGKIFYIDGTGQHCLIAATSDQSTGAQWGCYGTLIGGTGTAIGTGKGNTIAIVTGCSTSGIAAQICVTLTLNGYSDWFLPSKDELNQLYMQKTLVGGFPNNGILSYWSSTEIDNSAVWIQYFSNGGQIYDLKYWTYYVRAIRAFPSVESLFVIGTTDITNITQTTATSGGNIGSDGGAPVNARGVCWSTSANPTISNTHTADGSGTGSFVSNLTGLTANTPYYVRAYATNSVGTSYGNQVSFITSSAFAIGQHYGGGIIFYIDSTGQHGLISATRNQSPISGIQWYNGVNTIINAVRDSLYAGQYNTERIIINQGVGSYAAQICANYHGGGYGDWYLPSKYELNLLYLQKALVGGFTNDGYWSSSELDANGAWEQEFSNGNQDVNPKNYPNYARAVRAF